MKRGGRHAGGHHRRGFGGGPWLVPTYYVEPCDPLVDPWCYRPIVGAELLQRLPGYMSPVGTDMNTVTAGLVAEDPLWVQLDDSFRHLLFEVPNYFNPAVTDLYGHFVDDFNAWRTFFNTYLKTGPTFFDSPDAYLAQLNAWKERRVKWAADFETTTKTRLPGATKLEQPIKPTGSTLQPYLVGAGIAAGTVLLLSLLSRRI